MTRFEMVFRYTTPHINSFQLWVYLGLGVDGSTSAWPNTNTSGSGNSLIEARVAVLVPNCFAIEYKLSPIFTT